MTRERLKELWPVMEAFKAGKTIRARQRKCDGTYQPWGVVFDPIWADDADYEVMPEPREVWINEYGLDTGMVGLTAFPTKEAADERAHPRRIRAVRFVEVIE